MQFKSVCIGFAFCLLCMAIPVLWGFAIFLAIVLFLTGKLNWFWGYLKEPISFRAPSKTELHSIAGTIAEWTNISPAQVSDRLKDSVMGVAEYRGESGIVKVAAIAHAGTDEMHLMLREISTGKWKLTACKPEKVSK